MTVEMEAEAIRDGRYAVRPKGQLGTCGWWPIPWTVVYVNAPNARTALVKADKVARKAGINRYKRAPQP